MSLNGGQPNFAQRLAVSCAITLYIHFRRLLLPNRILPGAKFTLRPSLAFPSIGSAFEQCASAKLRRAIFTRQGSHPFRHLAVELSSIFFSFHILLVGWSAAAVSFYCHLLLNFFYIYIYMLSPGPTSKCERNINGLCMRVLQSACRTTEMQFKSPKPNRQALLLTITWIHIHAPWIPGHFRGGPST